MQVQREDSDRLELGGVPHGVRWMLFCCGLGAVFIAAAWFFGTTLWGQIQAAGAGKNVGPGGAGGTLFSWVGLVFMGVGGLMGLAFLVFGVVQVFERERLVLDKRTQTAAYRRWSRLPLLASVIGSSGWETELRFAKRVVVRTRREEGRRSQSGPEGGPLETTVVTAELEVTQPRKRVRLDETQNGRDERVRAVAERVGAFLGCGVEEG